jgi:hypothetical protein
MVVTLAFRHGVKSYEIAEKLLRMSSFSMSRSVFLSPF